MRAGVFGEAGIDGEKAAETVGEGSPGARVVTKLPAGTGRRGLLAAGVVAGAALAAWPFSATTLGDDFSYAKTALDFARTGHLLYPGWGASLLGWQAVWGALFIKLFGFSFNALRISTLLVAAASIYLFHEVLVRFGVGRRNALFGALTLGLTPLFLPLAASFMTDVPGLFSVLLCMWMCQRAIAAESDRAATAWIVAAAAGNVGTGTVRQICWLGVLVMVPSTAWSLRRRAGVLRAGVVACFLGAGAVYGCVRWLNRQPWMVPEQLFPGPPTMWRVGHLLLQWIKAVLFVVLITAPVGAGWGVAAVRRGARGRRLAAGGLALAGGIWLLLAATGNLEKWLMPWLLPVLSAQGMYTSAGPQLNVVTLGPAVRLLVSVLTAGMGFVLLGLGWRLPQLRQEGEAKGRQSCWWVLGPFSASLIALMSSRGMFYILQDRYLLLLVPSALVLLLLGYQRLTASELPAVCGGVLLVFAYFGVAGLHDQQAGVRADLRAVAQLRAAGIPRTAVAEGFGPDEWVEVGLKGHINNVNFEHSPLGTYDAHVPAWNLPPGCQPFDQEYVPSIQAVYFLTAAPGSCYAPSGFAPEPYLAWVPPFHRATYLVRSAVGRSQEAK